MRILVTADTIGGVWTYALELAGALAEHGVEVALATMGAALTAQQKRDVGKLADVEVFESEYKLEWMDEPWAGVEKSGNWLLELEQRVRPDVVHLNGYAHGALPWREAARMARRAHQTILSRHTCAHRVDELFEIYADLRHERRVRRNRCGRRRTGGRRLAAV